VKNHIGYMAGPPLRNQLQMWDVMTLFTPDTILRWHHRLVAKKRDYSHRLQKKPGRPALPTEVVELAVRLAKDNPTWGYKHIQGANLPNPGRVDRILASKRNKGAACSSEAANATSPPGRDLPMRQYLMA
jgi:hypothetical protein